MNFRFYLTLGMSLGGVRIFSGLKLAFPTKFGHKILKKCEKKKLFEVHILQILI